ncbi:unnamed protein product [Rotaria sp. Silwood1]|nr:unnamed protein product [Rotaria sp. Silwood1]
MNKDKKRLLDDIKFDSSSMKHIRLSITCLFDLPDKILLFICRYLSSYDILYAFYTPSTPEQRLHRMILDYRTKIKIDGIKNNEYNYLSKLFSHSQTPLQPKSLEVNNEHVTCLTYYYFTSTPEHVIQSMFSNLKHLTLTYCSESDLQYLNKYMGNLTELQYLHITIQKPDINQHMDYLKTCNILFNQLLFNEKQISSIRTINYQIYYGLLLNKSLISHDNLRNVNLVLQTIDDLYILLDGLVPNVQTMIIRVFQSKRRSCHYPQSARWVCTQLTDFTLIESSTEFVIGDMKSILAYMTNLIKLTLSIQDTLDPLFCHSPTIESMLNEYLPHLRQFHYTITHQMTKQILIENFVRWPMNITYYGMEHGRWIHIYSLPWASNKNDKQQLPIVRVESSPSVLSNVKRSAFLAIFSTNSTIQPSVHHLIVERRLYDEREMSILVHQFPHVKYLKLNLPLDQCPFINCLNILLKQEDNIKKTSCYWTELICFSTQLFYVHKRIISNESQLHDWFIRYSNLTCHKNFLDNYRSSSTLTIWY